MTISVTDAALDMEKKTIENCARRNSLRGWLIWIYCSVFLASFSIFFVFWCTNSFQDYVLSELELRNGTRSFAWWQRPPIKLSYKIYIFNYTNVNEFEAYTEDKLRVQEVGPYIYEETMSRVNVQLHENGTVTYQQKRSFQKIGGRPENETVTMPNIPLVSSMAFARDHNFAMQLGLTVVLSTLREQSFITETAGGLLWGYDSRFFHFIKPLLMFERDVPYDKFGILIKNSGIDKDRIMIHTGSRGLDDLGTIERINGRDSSNAWGDERCDKISGSEGNMFPPHLIKDTNTPLYIYAKEMCRALPFRFAEQAITHGVPTLRYKLSTDTFDHTRTQNQCFCPKVRDTRICPPKGFFNVSACIDVPMLISLPHFYTADESVLEQLDGLNPRQEDHESYMDVHPRLALPIAGWSRLQMNIEVRKSSGMPFFERLKDGTILPLIWIDVGVDELPKSIIELLHIAYFTVAAVEIIFQWCSLIAMILSLGALITCLRKYRMEQLADSPGQNKFLEAC